MKPKPAPDPGDLALAFACASLRAADARAEWAKRDGPFTLTYPNGMEGVHPMLKAVLECEKHAAMLWRNLQRVVADPEQNVDSLIDEILGAK